MTNLFALTREDPTFTRYALELLARHNNSPRPAAESSWYDLFTMPLFCPYYAGVDFNPSDPTIAPLLEYRRLLTVYLFALEKVTATLHGGGRGALPQENAQVNAAPYFYYEPHQAATLTVVAQLAWQQSRVHRWHEISHFISRSPTTWLMNLNHMDSPPHLRRYLREFENQLRLLLPHAVIWEAL